MTTDKQDKCADLRKLAERLRTELPGIAAELAGYADAWEAGRAGMSAVGAMNDGWVDNTGARPAEDNVLLDIELRNGDRLSGEAASRWDFELIYGAGDVVRWRFHQDKTK